MPSKAPRYQKWIPLPIQALFDGKAMRTKLLTGVPHSEAKAVRRELEVRDERLFRAVARLPDDVKAKIIAAGGVEAVGPQVEELRDMVAHAVPVPMLMASDHSAWLQAGQPLAPAHVDQLRLKMLAWQESNRAKLAELEPVALVAEPSPEFSFRGLFTLWAKGGAKKPRHYQATAKLLHACYGAVDYRTLDPVVKAGWRFADWLHDNDIAPASQENHIGRARAMYKAASRYLTHGNPFADVKPIDTYHERQKGKFSTAQLRNLLGIVETVKFGATRIHKRHLEALWMLRLCVWTGCRVNEAASLRKADVLLHRDGQGDDFVYLYFRADAVKAKKGEDRSRKVPLHPEIGPAFYAFAHAVEGAHVFGKFEDSKDNGRAAWLVSNLPGFMRKHAAAIGVERRGEEIVDGDERRLTLHSIRHSYHSAVMAARLHADSQRILVGHAGKDVHERVYATDLALRLLYDDVCKVKPLG